VKAGVARLPIYLVKIIFFTQHGLIEGFRSWQATYALSVEDEGDKSVPVSKG